MGQVFRVRDPVHDFVRLREIEIKLIGAPIFQRLRGIRQLALANLVYPGALHTRFDHSLGVCHVAGMMAEALGLDAKEAEHEYDLVRLAALLHDLGHGPFSHVSEHSLERYADRSKLSPAQKKEKIHELITAHFIANDPDLVRTIGRDRCDRLVKLLSEGHGQRALKGIVSGPLDADKQDYLLRDSMFCGVTYGVFDIHQLHRSLALSGPDHDKELMIKPDGIHAVEQFVMAKYYLTTNVYRHRVRLITDRMIVRAIEVGIDIDEIQLLRKLYSFDNSPEFFSNYATWDDSRFMHVFGVLPRRPGLCHQLLDRLRNRTLLKQVFSKPIREFKAAYRKQIAGLDEVENSARRARIETAIAQILSTYTSAPVEPNFVIAHPFTIKSVRTTSRNDEAGILVAKEPKPKPFELESTLFRSIRDRYTDAFIEVYAPVTWESTADRAKLRIALRQPIVEVIEQESFLPKKEARHESNRLRSPRAASYRRRDKGKH